jgi:hypothetical protein
MAADRAGPILICCDGSDDARHAIETAAGLLGDRHALIVTVWQQTAALGSFNWSMANRQHGRLRRARSGRRRGRRPRRR